MLKLHDKARRQFWVGEENESHRAIISMWFPTQGFIAISKLIGSWQEERPLLLPYLTSTTDSKE